MKDTVFVNCTGLPAAGHHSSAYDIALMSRELILHHPDIRTYTTIWMDSIRDGAFGLTNTNRLVRFYPGATGLKTGSTDSALYCLSATAERDGMELIAVVMKAPSSAHRFGDAKALLDYGFSAWSLVSIYPDTPLAPIPVLLGTVDQIQPQLARDCRLLVRKEQEGAVTTRPDPGPGSGGSSGARPDRGGTGGLCGRPGAGHGPHSGRSGCRAADCAPDFHPPAPPAADGWISPRRGGAASRALPGGFPVCVCPSALYPAINLLLT